MTDDVVARLKAVPLFKGMSEKDLKPIAASCVEVTRDPGDEITTEGKDGIAFFLMVEGAAEVFQSGQRQRALGPGDHFGEISLIDGGPRTATVTITEPSKLLGLSAWNFRPMLTEHPEMAQALLLGLCKMIRAYEHT